MKLYSATTCRGHVVSAQMYTNWEEVVLYGSTWSGLAAWSRHRGITTHPRKRNLPSGWTDHQLLACHDIDDAVQAACIAGRYHFALQIAQREGLRISSFNTSHLMHEHHAVMTGRMADAGPGNNAIGTAILAFLDKGGRIVSIKR